MGCFMYQYPKQILTIDQQVQSYIDVGMEITSREDIEKALKLIGFYRLRGYSFHLYDNAAKKYVPGRKFEDIIKLYQFDQKLSALVFKEKKRYWQNAATVASENAYFMDTGCFSIA